MRFKTYGYNIASVISEHRKINEAIRFVRKLCPSITYKLGDIKHLEIEIRAKKLLSSEKPIMRCGINTTKLDPLTEKWHNPFYMI